MKNVYIYCEGQTEESFVNAILTPYFANLSIYARPIVCTTKRTVSGKFKGGVSDYNKIKNELQILCKSHKNEYITTMFDYYAMPANTPMIECDETDIFKRMEMIEQVVNTDIGQGNCVFNLMLHEFEGILFSNPASFALVTNDETVVEIKRMRDGVASPEHINNSFETAPSKRLEGLISDYSKVKNGTILSKDMGIDKIMRECKHFSDWIGKIRDL